MNADDFARLASPSYPLADALAWGVPLHVREDARLAGCIDLTREDGPPVRFLHSAAWMRNRGEWTAKRSWKGRTLTGYAGGHAPRGGGVAGLSDDGVRRAIAGLDRQERRWATGAAQRKTRGPVCPTCGRLAPLDV